MRTHPGIMSRTTAHVEIILPRKARVSEAERSVPVFQPIRLAFMCIMWPFRNKGSRKSSRMIHPLAESDRT